MKQGFRQRLQRGDTTPQRSYYAPSPKDIKGETESAVGGSFRDIDKSESEWVLVCMTSKKAFFLLNARREAISIHSDFH